MTRRACLSLATAAVGLAVAGGSAWAEKMDCSGTKRSLSSPYSEVIEPGDNTSHQLKQQIRVHVISSKDPDFDGAEQTVYAHHDEYAGSGTSVGYFMYTLKNGEKLWAKFDSVYSTVSTPGGPERWESTYQGVFRFISGTGKYSGIRGGGQYKGTVTPSAGFRETSVCSAEY
jgi:hypothetical protein